METRDDVLKLYPNVDINTDGATDAYREGLPIIERDNVAVIIKHPTEDLYLLADWIQSVWKGLLTGGIEGSDTLEETARKEILEEAGYKNIAKITPTDFSSHALFFHPVKNVNRLAHYHLVVAELKGLEQEPVSEKEQSIARFIWIPREEVLATITRPSMKQLWSFYAENLAEKSV